PVAQYAAHLPLLAAAAILHTAARRELTLVLNGQVGPYFLATLAFFIDLIISSYLIALWASRVMQTYGVMREAERRTSRLRSEVGNARIEFLERQLRPHFLFNA